MIRWPERVAAVAAENPAVRRYPKVSIWARRMTTSSGGMGTRRVSSEARCLSPRSSWAESVSVQRRLTSGRDFSAEGTCFPGWLAARFGRRNNPKTGWRQCSKPGQCRSQASGERMAAVPSGSAARGEDAADVRGLLFAVAIGDRVQVVQVAGRGVARQVALQGRACSARRAPVLTIGMLCHRPVCPITNHASNDRKTAKP